MNTTNPITEALAGLDTIFSTHHNSTEADRIITALEDADIHGVDAAQHALTFFAEGRMTRKTLVEIVAKVTR